MRVLHLDMKLTFPDNLQVLADNAFRYSDKSMLAVLTGTDDWKSESKTRLAIAKAILSSVGYTEPDHPFQLPTPPPVMKWHRADGWTSKMLPQCWRPLVLGESIHLHDECWDYGVGPFMETRSAGVEARVDHHFHRTRRPLTFTHLGHEWTWHRAGDPMPCDGDKKVVVLGHWPDNNTTEILGAYLARDRCWDDNSAILGWRYANDKADKLAELQARIEAIKTELEALK